MKTVPSFYTLLVNPILLHIAQVAGGTVFRQHTVVQRNVKPRVNFSIKKNITKCHKVLSYRPFHKTIPGSSAFVNLISARFLKLAVYKKTDIRDEGIIRF